MLVFCSCRNIIYTYRYLQGLYFNISAITVEVSRKVLCDNKLNFFLLTLAYACGHVSIWEKKQ